MPGVPSTTLVYRGPIGGADFHPLFYRDSSLASLIKQPILLSPFPSPPTTTSSHDGTNTASSAVAPIHIAAPTTRANAKMEEAIAVVLHWMVATDAVVGWWPRAHGGRLLMLTMPPIQCLQFRAPTGNNHPFIQFLQGPPIRCLKTLVQYTIWGSWMDMLLICENRGQLNPSWPNGKPTKSSCLVDAWWRIDYTPLGTPRGRYDNHNSKSSLSCETKVYRISRRKPNFRRWCLMLLVDVGAWWSLCVVNDQPVGNPKRKVWWV
jgi:hypothetical protein